MVIPQKNTNKWYSNRNCLLEFFMNSIAGHLIHIRRSALQSFFVVSITRHVTNGDVFIPCLSFRNVWLIFDWDVLIDDDAMHSIGKFNTNCITFGHSHRFLFNSILSICRWEENEKKNERSNTKRFSTVVARASSTTLTHFARKKIRWLFRMKINSSSIRLLCSRISVDCLIASDRIELIWIAKWKNRFPHNERKDHIQWLYLDASTQFEIWSEQ